LPAELIDGKAIAESVRKEVAADVERLRRECGVTPGLAVILVGNDPASHTYVSSKAKMCIKLGMNSIKETFPADFSEDKLIAYIRELNARQDVHGILVQLPLPAHVNSRHVIMAVDPRKDVDGLHPENIGLLCMGEPRFIPCTPLGICELLRRSNVEVCGREVVVLGRSGLVGRPISILLSSKNKYGDATVTICHSRSQNKADICRRADILIVAIGRKRFVTADMVKPGAVVIDVGTHPPQTDQETFCGDVDFVPVKEVASKITPVPGGVGPMTIAMLMRNTVDAAFNLSKTPRC
jgi:methylenetetrahydrofolate dehydrogenase (NADP+) / methenyltetrahydrofolate cyclohydrolase